MSHNDVKPIHLFFYEIVSSIVGPGAQHTRIENVSQAFAKSHRNSLFPSTEMGCRIKK